MKSHRRATRWRWPAGVAPWFTLVMLSILLPCCSPSQAKYAYGWERWFYPSISGRVVDADTGGPIEGAVAFCVWTKQHGMPGLLYTKVAKVSESVTDSEGWFRIDGTLDPNVEAPSVTIYKRGYVAWSNKEIFPNLERRKDFRWQNGAVVKLQRWQAGYSYDKHQYFYSRYTGYPESEFDRRRFLFFKATEWEVPFIVEENNLQNERKKKERGGSKE